MALPVSWPCRCPNPQRTSTSGPSRPASAVGELPTQRHRAGRRPRRTHTEGPESGYHPDDGPQPRAIPAAQQRAPARPHHVRPFKPTPRRRLRPLRSPERRHFLIPGTGFTSANAHHGNSGDNQVQGYLVVEGLLRRPALNVEAESFAALCSQADEHARHVLAGRPLSPSRHSSTPHSRTDVRGVRQTSWKSWPATS